MDTPHLNFNPHLSVDCAVFGFDGTDMRVLLIRRDAEESESHSPVKYKLPGDLIIKMEDLDVAASRILENLTGLKDVFLRQFSVFGDPGRTANPDDKHWLEETSGIEINRVVTTAYFALIRIDSSKRKFVITNNASWHKVDQLPPLVFDHEEIIQEGVQSVRRAIKFEPICFNLLPRRFTLRQVQNLYEAILGTTLDNRNFRKKLLKAKYIHELDEKQSGVAHKPARFYRFSKRDYHKYAGKDLYYYF